MNSWFEIIGIGCKIQPVGNNTDHQFRAMARDCPLLEDSDDERQRAAARDFHTFVMHFLACIFCYGFKRLAGSSSVELCHFSSLACCNCCHHDLSSWHHLSSSLNPSLAIVEPNRSGRLRSHPFSSSTRKRVPCWQFQWNMGWTVDLVDSC